MSDIAQINSANQQQLTTLISEFTAGYQAFTGMVPPGLSGLRGLGQVDPVSWTTIAGAIVAIGVIAAASYALIQQTSANYATAQARLTAAQSSSTLLQQAAAAYSSGDTATGDSLTAAAAAGSSSGFDINSFLTNNWAWLAGGALVLFLGPSLIKKL
jgi:hypothetical protein